MAVRLQEPPPIAGLHESVAPCAALLRIPHPYRAMLAICSDLDETPHAKAYAEIMRFMNTSEPTAMGPGVGLEVGNTIYFDMPKGQFSYWGTDDAGRAMVRSLIHSGHIDCLHSFGDHATTRAHAERALDELRRHDCRIRVWVDHAQAVTNFGADIMQGRGDVLDHPAYHADLTTEYGVRFVWRGRVSSVIGQDVAPSVGGIFDPANPGASFRTLLKEAAKGWAARFGSAKFAMHAHNRVYRVAALRDGRRVIEFMRGDPHSGGLGLAATADGFARVVTERFLDRLVEREGVCILYTHLGKVRDPDRPFAAPTVEAFRRLASYYESKQILVTTTARLLRYLVARDYLVWNAVRTDAGVLLALGAISDPLGGSRAPALNELAGLTFHVPRGAEVVLRCDEGTAPLQLTRLGADMVQFPWTALTYPLRDA